MSNQDKAMQWFRKQMLIHQSSEKAKNAYKKIQQASLRQYTIEKYGVADNSPPGLAHVSNNNESNFSDDVTQSFYRGHPPPLGVGPRLGEGASSSTPLHSASHRSRSPRTMGATSPLRLEAMRPLPHGEGEASIDDSAAAGSPHAYAPPPQDLTKVLRDQRKMQERSKQLVAQLDAAHSSQVHAENESLLGVVRDLSRDHRADQIALVDTVANGALVEREAKFVKKQNRSLAEANRTMYDKAVRAENEASQLREELDEAQMQLRVCQKLYDTEQKNSLQSFSAVGQLKKELAKANSTAMKARMEHMERVQKLQSELAEETRVRRTAESAVDELKKAAASAHGKLRGVTEQMTASKAAEKETSREIAAQLSEVVQTERLLQEQNRQVMDMLHEELADEQARTKQQDEQLAAAADQLESYETALQDRLRASMDLEVCPMCSSWPWAGATFEVQVPP